MLASRYNSFAPLRVSLIIHCVAVDNLPGQLICIAKADEAWLVATQSEARQSECNVEETILQCGTLTKRRMTDWPAEEDEARQPRL